MVSCEVWVGELVHSRTIHGIICCMHEEKSINKPGVYRLCLMAFLEKGIGDTCIKNIYATLFRQPIFPCLNNRNESLAINGAWMCL